MPLTQLSNEEVSETLTRAREIAAYSRELDSPEREYDAYLQAAEEMGVPREAMLQALRERMLVPGENMEVGQHVFAPSADGYWYVAELLSTSDHTAKVRFLSSGEHTCALADLRPLGLIPGRKLQADVKDWGWYKCYVLRHDAEKNKVQVSHDDWAPQQEWVNLRKLRLTKDHVHPKKTPDTREDTKGILARAMLLALGFGTVLGFFLDRILPHLFPFFR